MRSTVVFFFLLGFLSAPLFAKPIAVFTGATEDSSDLFALDGESLATLPLTTEKSREEQPAISPDGKKIAFVSDQTGARSLYWADFVQPLGKWESISPGMGAYSNPAFSPDGKTIAAAYGPDPEDPWKSTKIVLVDPVGKKQTVALECAALRPPDPGGSITIVDRPTWVNDKAIVFVEIEYSDPQAPRILSSTLHRLDLSTGKTQRLSGGESYFDENGKPKGFMATLPFYCGPETSQAGLLTFVAVQGRLDRTPMTMTPDGSDKKVLPLNDEDFFGPVFPIGNRFLYGINDQSGKSGLAIQETGKNAARKLVPFAGDVRDPTPVP